MREIEEAIEAYKQYKNLHEETSTGAFDAMRVGKQYPYSDCRDEGKKDVDLDRGNKHEAYDCHNDIARREVTLQQHPESAVGHPAEAKHAEGVFENTGAPHDGAGNKQSAPCDIPGILRILGSEGAEQGPYACKGNGAKQYSYGQVSSEGEDAKECSYASDGVLCR